MDLRPRASRPVGDDGQAGVVQAEFTRQSGLGHVGHADQVAAVAAHARDLGARLEPRPLGGAVRSEEHTSELQSLMRISYAVFCLNKKKHNTNHIPEYTTSLQYIC